MTTHFKIAAALPARTGFVLAAIMPLVAVLGLAGCVANGETTPETPRGEVNPRDNAPLRTDKSGMPRISLDSAEVATLGLAIRTIGERFGGGAVLMSGLEDRAVARVSFSNSEFVAGIKKLVSAGVGEFQVTPHYLFIYPPGYKQLTSMTLDGRLGPRFETVHASFALGAGTEMYNALSLLGSTLNTTLVADNPVAEAWCGELFLDNAPLSAILEALLKSARVPDHAIEVRSTEEYVFIRGASYPLPPTACVNADTLTAAQRTLLDSRVALQLPRKSEEPTFEAGATPLEELRAEMSRQLGVPVTVDTALAKLPVNPVVIRDVRLETALNLIVWQWPVLEFGYRVTSSGIHFERRKPA